MTSETLIDYAPTPAAEILRTIDPQILEGHKLGEDVASAYRTNSSQELLGEGEDEIADNLTIEFKRRSEHHISLRQPHRTTILPASGVTTDFDELRFEAAAARQLRFSQPQSQRHLQEEPESGDELLISSPYNHPQHLLDLKTLDTQNRLLALALAALKPIRPDYPTADYLEIFNWLEVLRILRLFAKNEGHEWREQKFYTVIFRSKLNQEIDGERLGELDQHSHREATESGGLLKYWFGKASVVGTENLATCEFCPHPWRVGIEG